jgi:DNA polymerase-1
MNSSEALNPARLLIVDGHAYAYRAFYAIRQLNSPEGLGTNAIYGFIKMLVKMQARVNPSHVAVVWDGGLDAGRKQLHPDYKAQRPASPVDLDRQISEIQEYLENAGFPTCQEEGMEADDLIGSLCEEALKDGFSVVIASSDKDFMQLVNERVGILNPNDKSETIWGAAQVREKTGVNPSQVLDWLALIGDAVDNIPGVAGVGPKTAADLLEQFGTVDWIYARLDEVKSDRMRALLKEAEATVRKNQTLVRLKSDVRGSLDVCGCLVRPANDSRLMDLYRRWGFKTMLRELEERAEAQPCLL